MRWQLHNAGSVVLCIDGRQGGVIGLGGGSLQSKTGELAYEQARATFVGMKDGRAAGGTWDGTERDPQTINAERMATLDWTFWFRVRASEKGAACR